MILRDLFSRDTDRRRESLLFLIYTISIIFLYLIPFIIHRTKIINLHSWHGALCAGYFSFKGVINSFPAFARPSLIPIVIGRVLSFVKVFKVEIFMGINFLLLWISMLLTDDILTRLGLRTRINRFVAPLVWITPYILVLCRNMNSMTYSLFLMFFCFYAAVVSIEIRKKSIYPVLFFLNLIAVLSHRSLVIYQAYMLFVLSFAMLDAEDTRLDIFLKVVFMWLGYFAGLPYYLSLLMKTPAVMDGVSSGFYFHWHIIFSGLWGLFNFVCSCAFVIVFVKRLCSKQRFETKETFMIWFGVFSMIMVFPLLIMLGKLLDKCVMYQFLYPVSAFFMLSAVLGFSKLSKSGKVIFIAVKILCLGLILANNIFLAPVASMIINTKNRFVEHESWKTPVYDITCNAFSTPPLYNFPYYVSPDYKQDNQILADLYDDLDAYFTKEKNMYFYAKRDTYRTIYFLESYAVNRGYSLEYASYAKEGKCLIYIPYIEKGEDEQIIAEFEDSSGLWKDDKARKYTEVELRDEYSYRCRCAFYRGYIEWIRPPRDAYIIEVKKG